MRAARLALTLIALGALAMGATLSRASSPDDERAIRQAYDAFSAALAQRDLKQLLAIYAPGDSVVLYDAFVPRQFVGAAAIRKDYVDFLAAFPGSASSKMSDIRIVTSGTFAYAYGIDHWTVTDAAGKRIEMVFRFTDVWRKMGGRWRIVHEHLSFPADPATGQADLMSKP